MALNPLGINVGTNSYINFDQQGTVNTQVVNIGTINGNLPGGSIAVTAGTVQISGGTINLGTVQMSSGTLNVGTISTLPNLPQGSINVTAGTIGTVTGVGSISSLGSLAMVNAGTISMLNAGTIGTVTGTGTVTNLGSVTNVGQVYNAGTLQGGTINTGTFVMPSGTLTVLPSLPQGSINVTAGTIATLGTMGTLGTLTNVGQVYNAGTVQNGTIHVNGTTTDLYAAIGTFTITVGTLASSSTGVGRQSTLIDNTANLYQAAELAAQITPGTVTAAGIVSIYLIRSDNGAPIADDNAGASDAGWTQQNAPLLYNMAIAIGTNTQYKALFDTGNYRLGPKWGIGVVHNLGNPFNATAGSHSITYTGITSKMP